MKRALLLTAAAIVALVLACAAVVAAVGVLWIRDDVRGSLALFAAGILGKGAGAWLGMRARRLVPELYAERAA